MDESDDIIERGFKWYLIYRFLLASFWLGVGVVAGVCFIIYWIHSELSLEWSYKQKYGADWQMEFEKYHGTLSHAHTQLAICVTGILAIVAVLTWFCHQTFHRHRRHRHEHHVA